MAMLDDYPAQLRESTDSNRTEFLKHISIVSVAGLGFNLVTNIPENLAWNFPTVFWAISVVGFLVATIFVIAMFYISSIRARVLLRADNSGADKNARLRYLETADRLNKVSGWCVTIIIIAFTLAIVSAIMVAIHIHFY